MNELGNLLSRRLKIPVDSGINFGTFAEVKYNEQNLGTVQIIQAPGNLIVDDSPESVSNLRWEFIYHENRELLNRLVAKQFNELTESLVITNALFRKLYVRNTNGDMLGSVICTYENEEWHVDKLS